MNAQSNITTTVRQLQDDDIACQMVLRTQQNPQALHDPQSARAQRVHEMANQVIREGRMPNTVGEWVSVVLVYRHMPEVQQMVTDACSTMQVSYVQAERWLKLINHRPTRQR